MPALDTTGYSSTYLAMGFANVRAGTQNKNAAAIARSVLESLFCVLSQAVGIIRFSWSCGRVLAGGGVARGADGCMRACAAVAGGARLRVNASALDSDATYAFNVSVSKPPQRGSSAATQVYIQAGSPPPRMPTYKGGLGSLK